jgi:ubiquinone biosynthesis protein COQ4
MARSTRLRPLVAYRAMRVLRQNPDDTAQAIMVIAALSGNSGRRLFKRFERSPLGVRILRERRDLYDILSDTDGLRAMPEGSLGKTIGDWFVRENISTGSNEQGRRGKWLRMCRRRTVFSTRLRNLRDVFHVVAG